MGISIEFADDAEMQARIKVVGVGGGGGNALNTMIHSGLEGVEFIAANTDMQALDANLAPTKIQLGPALTKGLGAGANPDVGRKAALEDVQRVSESLEGADMVFITAGMGGGTGTGGAPIIAQIARDLGALTVGVVTKPFLFEGKRRSRNADDGIDDLAESVDTIITIPNQKLLNLEDEDMSLLEAFRRADDVLVQAVRGISDLITHSGMINVDFADVKTIMSQMGRALMGTGYGKGDRRAVEAAEMAINSPLLDEVSVEGATGILINFTAGPDVRLKEINEAASLVQQEAHEDANIIFGLVTDMDMGDVVKVTVIATGFDQQPQAVEEVVQQAQGSPRQSRPSIPVQVPSRPSVASMKRDAMRDSMRPRRSAPPEQVSLPESRVPGRAFGASALHDEAVLDIPAYLRRGE
ncbi:MAG TPA: cell division protein FtsZ [Sandaracinaceae bacterium LLY-WYZ-13_1]|nr:cell division protein FtsZ [Sandaracinaceae bacterium LLY-WYZ-13_1]